MAPSFLTLLDWRLASRRLRRAPAFTCASVLLLAVPIAAATLVFSLVRGLLFDSIPYPNPDRLVVLAPDAPAVMLAGAPAGLPTTGLATADESTAITSAQASGLSS